VLNRERRELACELVKEHFPDETVVWVPEGGFLLWAEVPQSIDMEAAYQAALKQNVAFSRGTAFYTTPETRINAMRLNCSRPTKEQLVAGLEILGKILCRQR